MSSPFVKPSCDGATVDAVGAAARDDEDEGFLDTIDGGSFSDLHATDCAWISGGFGWFDGD